MTHTQIIIGIIIAAGLLGGITNFLLLYKLTYTNKESWLNFLKSISLSLCASFTVPLFLQIISNNLLEIQKDSPFPDKNYFVLLGFCVLAAFYSKRFLEDLYSKVNKAEQKAEEAKGISEEAKEISEQAKIKLESTEKEMKETQVGQKFIYFNEDNNASLDNKKVEGNRNADMKPQNIKHGYIDKEHTMLAVAAGTTFEDNLKYNIYYDPALRTHGYHFRYIGLYKSWAIRAVGEVSKIVYCDYDKENDVLIPTKDDDVFITLTRDEKERIKKVIKETDYYELERGNKFFLVDKFYETEYTLDSPIQGKQYFWLNEFLGFNKNMSSNDLAALLSNLNTTHSI